MIKILSCALAGVLSLTAPAQTLLRDLTPPPGSPASGSPGVAVQFGSLAVFAATDEYGREPWITDGTTPGTRRLCDCDPGSGSSSPSDFTVVGSRVFFVARRGGFGRELW